MNRAVQAGVEDGEPSGLGTRINQMFAEIGGVDLTIPEDAPPRLATGFEP